MVVFTFISNSNFIYATVNLTQKTREDSIKNTDVLYEQSSSFTVTIPKKITLDSNKTSEFNVTVEGDIASDKKILVVPESSFLMKDQATSGVKKSDVKAVVTQSKTEWFFDELGTIENGTVEAKELTSGSWAGTFFFNIEMQENLAPGLYGVDGGVLCTWDELVNDYGIDIEKDYADENLNIAVSAYWDVPGLRFSYNEDVSALNDDLSACTKLVIGEGVTKIGSGAFYGNATIEEIVIPDSVETINLAAFLNCQNLKKVTIPETVEFIGPYAFAECVYLADINIPQNLTTIEDYAFYDCMSLENIVLPNEIEEIKYCAFGNCVSATNITLGNSVKTVGEHAFSGCTALTNITLPESVETLGEGAFWCCYNLKSINMSSNINYIGNSAFRGCIRLENIEIPNSVEKIGAYTFKDCVSLKDIKLSDNLKEIEMYAFYDCDSLKTITIPNSVEIIHKEVFNDCDYLLEIFYNGDDNNAPWGATNATVKKY